MMRLPMTTLPGLALLAAIVTTALLTAGLAPAAAETELFRDDPLIVAVYENNVDETRSLVVRRHPMARTTSEGRTALMWGAIQNSYESVQILLEAQARPNLVDDTGNSALYLAADNGNAEIVGLLLEYGAEIDQENRDGRTPLMAAARNGHLAAIEALIAGGADVNHADYTGRTVLDIARDGRSRQVEQALIRAGAR